MRKMRLSLILVCLIIALVLFSCQQKPADTSKGPKTEPVKTTPVTPPPPAEKPITSGPEGQTVTPGGEPAKPGETTPGGTTTTPPTPTEPPKKEPPAGLAIYTQNCVTCHKVSNKPDIPGKGNTDLAGIGKKYPDAVKMKGKLGKPPHDAIIKKLKEKDVDDLIKFLLTL